MFHQSKKWIRCGQSEVTRTVRLFVPSPKISDECPVVFCADGQTTKYFADRLQESDHNWPLVLVGVDHDPRNRAVEYVFGNRPEAFANHELFFTETVFDWAHQEFKLKTNRNRTVVFGYSCGGAFATSMAVRHPDKYVGAIAMSIAGRPVRVDQDTGEVDLSNSRFCLAAGQSEISGMKKYMKRLEKWLGKQGAACRHSVIRGDHNLELWTGEFGPALNWLLDRD
jgi:predicted esterase